MPPADRKPKQSRFGSRKIHRWVGIGAAVLFLLVSVTGVFLQIEQIFGAEEAAHEAMAAMVSPASLARSLRPDGEALDRARASVLSRFGDQPVAALDWQIKGPAQHYIFHLDGPKPLRVDVNAATGVIVESRPDGEDWLLKLHTGEIIGDGGKVLGLGWGLALVTMLVTGILAYLNMYRARQRGSAKSLRGWGRYFWAWPLALLVPVAQPIPARADPTTPTSTVGPERASADTKTDGWSFNPDAGLVYQTGDARLTLWGFAVRAFDPDGPDYFRRFRQGAELDLPRITEGLRPAVVYEVDLTNTDFFGDFGEGGHVGRRNLENLFFALQHPDDPSKFRLLIGENTHILSREDNLSSGNLPTVNRSLILEEHGSVNSFGSQFGIELQKALSDKLTVQLAALDNRGSLNSPEPRYEIGNSLSGRLIFTPINSDGRKLTLGAAVDHTRNIRGRTFTLATAIGAAPLGSVEATGDKLSGEADLAYTFPLAGHPTTIEAEAIYSSFSRSNSDVGGGYVQGQFSLFDGRTTGDLDLFVRYDLVSLGIDSVEGRATQQALRAGVNYNLPHTNKRVNLHLEYAHNSLSGPGTIISNRHPSDEFRAVLRASLQRYARH